MKHGYISVGKEQDTTTAEKALRKAGCENIIVETARASNEHPKLEKLIASIGKGDTLTVPTVETLGRSFARTAEIVKELTDRGGTLFVLEGKVSSGSPDDRLVFGVLAALTEYNESNNNEEHPARENYIVAQALFEWVKTEEKKPRNEQRFSDMEDAKQILDKRFDDELPFLEAAQEARDSLPSGGLQ